ncbi:S8 family serine peptidase [Streptomyces sp. ME02-8801-2C]|uniref:S8 family serine peptidase n=1 Tax=Streptomyces sp. ME02-8801-2C TaxID=3028680 RepID=UPI0029A30584|nr:S8 family serine peptidase [Streptomyces sp. ME02-8801-2C]MDX3452983.1 S8 family serine peptidase [Streptomyces sp. ME02-8801-2C]
MRAARTLRSQGAAVVAPLLVALLVTLLVAMSAAVPAAADSVKLPAVRSVLAADEPCTPASAEHASGTPWALAALGHTRSLTLSQGAEVTVAVVDTGVSPNVPGLAGRVTALAGAGVDCVGHGTFAAGLIAGAGEAGGGPAGLAPLARILAVRATDERGNVLAARVADGVRAAADAGASVIYVSVALAGRKDQLTEAVEYASRKDALVVAPLAPDALPKDRATGELVRPQPWYWPAAVPGVLAVTDYGPDGGRPDNAPVVSGADLAAPGDSVVGLGARGTGDFIGSGASLAAAHVAGAAALVRARYPEMSAAEVSRQLTEAAYPAAPPRLDPYAALTAVLAEAPGAMPRPAKAVVPAAVSSEPRRRALVVAGVGVGVLVLVAALGVVVPRGRARGWRPAG